MSNQTTQPPQSFWSGLLQGATGYDNRTGDVHLLGSLAGGVGMVNPVAGLLMKGIQYGAGQLGWDPQIHTGGGVAPGSQPAPQPTQQNTDPQYADGMPTEFIPNAPTPQALIGNGGNSDGSDIGGGQNYTPPAPTFAGNRSPNAPQGNLPPQGTSFDAFGHGSDAAYYGEQAADQLRDMGQNMQQFYDNFPQWSPEVQAQINAATTGGAPQSAAPAAVQPVQTAHTDIAPAATPTVQSQPAPVNIPALRAQIMAGGTPAAAVAATPTDPGAGYKFLKYANGGAVSGLASAAQQLQSYGRGSDTLLAHMSPDEAAFIDKIQGGTRVNPTTGLPEYGLLGNILKALVRGAGAIVGFTVGGPLGAAAGAGLTTKLTGGSWNDALQSAALSGVGGELGQGLSGGGWNAMGTPAAAGAAGASDMFGVAGGAAPAADSLGIAGGVSSGAIPAAAATPGLGAQIMSGLGGAGGVSAGLAAATSQDGPSNGPAPLPVPPPSTFRLNNVLPAQRTFNPYQGDPNHFGANPQGWDFFTPINPPIAYANSPPPATMARGGRVKRYAFGGSVVNGPTQLGGGGLPDPQLRGVPALSPHGLAMPEMPAGGASLPAPRQAALMRALMLGYGGSGYAAGGPVVAPGIAQAAAAGYSAMALGGNVHIPRGPRGPEINRMPSTAAMSVVHGPGTGKSDSVPALLSQNEHIVDAPTISAMGGGSSDAGHKVMENIKTEVRRRAGFKNPGSPPPSGIAALVTRAQRKAGVRV